MVKRNRTAGAGIIVKYRSDVHIMLDKIPLQIYFHKQHCTDFEVIVVVLVVVCVGSTCRLNFYLLLRFANFLYCYWRLEAARTK